MHKLIDFVCDELDDLERKAEKDGKLSMAEIQYGDTLAHMKKNLLTAQAMEEGDGYSRDDGMMYHGGSYARTMGRNPRRDSMGRYSLDNYGYSRAEDDMAEMVTELRGIAQGLPADKQREVKDFIRKMEQM